MNKDIHKEAVSKPLVSVVIPVYNHKKWLVQAVKSVLRQTYQNFEILLIDDGSEEKIYDGDIFTDKRIHYYRNSNHGAAYSRNFGIERAKGKYIAFLDSDDFWKKNKLEVQVDAMEHTGMKWSQHSYYYYDDRKQKVTARVDTYKYHYQEARFQFCSFRVQTSCFMVDRECVMADKFRFDETKTVGEDAAFYIQFMKKGYQLLCIDAYLSYFRIRGTNSGMDAARQLASRADCWRENCSDLFFRQNVSVPCYAAYFYCHKVEKSALGLSERGKMLSALIYAPVWVLFRLEAKWIEIGGKVMKICGIQNSVK